MSYRIENPRQKNPLAEFMKLHYSSSAAGKDKKQTRDQSKGKANDSNNKKGNKLTLEHLQRRNKAGYPYFIKESVSDY
jgi:hypothetical protein